MQEVFEKIIEKLESEYEDIKEIYKRTKDMSFYFTFQGVNKAIEIVKKESEKSYHGHFGCNTNGEHERCDGCGLTNCKSRNKCWFGAVDDDTDTNIGSDGWIPVSESLPCESGYYLATYHEWSNGDYLPKFDDTYVRRLHYQRSEHFVGWNYPHCVDEMAEADTNREVIAWMNLPAPYQPKGE